MDTQPEPPAGATAPSSLLWLLFGVQAISGILGLLARRDIPLAWLQLSVGMGGLIVFGLRKFQPRLGRDLHWAVPIVFTTVIFLNGVAGVLELRDGQTAEGVLLLAAGVFIAVMIAASRRDGWSAGTVSPLTPPRKPSPCHDSEK